MVISLKCENEFTDIKSNIMNTTEAKGNWNIQKAKLKQKYADLTDDDLMYDEGQRDEMLGKLQVKLSKTKEELVKFIESL